MTLYPATRALTFDLFLCALHIPARTVEVVAACTGNSETEVETSPILRHDESSDGTGTDVLGYAEKQSKMKVEKEQVRGK